MMNLGYVIMQKKEEKIEHYYKITKKIKEIVQDAWKIGAYITEGDTYKTQAYGKHLSWKIKNGKIVNIKATPITFDDLPQSKKSQWYE